MHVLYYEYSAMFPIRAKRISKIEFFEKPTPPRTVFVSFLFLPSPFHFDISARLRIYAGRIFQARRELFLINRENVHPLWD